MILTLPPAYIGGSFGVEFDLAVARIRLSALGQPFFRTLSACLVCRFATTATSLDKT
jgi:hypothetical protein